MNERAVMASQEELERESTHRKKTLIQLFGSTEAEFIAVKLQRIRLKSPGSFRDRHPPSIYLKIRELPNSNPW
jgi:hypothetical protein